MKLHFICRDNVLRSLIAETYVKSLDLDDVVAILSGTNVDWSNSLEREYFANTLVILDRHGIASFAKTQPHQLTQARLDDNHDVVILMNQRVTDEAAMIVKLPQHALNWAVVDIGEGHRTHANDREVYEEEIYHEIIERVNDLLEGLGYRA